MKLTRRAFVRQASGVFATATLLPNVVKAAQAKMKVGSCVVGLDAAKQAGEAASADWVALWAPCRPWRGPRSMSGDILTSGQIQIGLR